MSSTEQRVEELYPDLAGRDAQTTESTPAGTFQTRGPIYRVLKFSTPDGPAIQIVTTFKAGKLFRLDGRISPWIMILGGSKRHPLIEFAYTLANDLTVFDGEMYLDCRYGPRVLVLPKDDNLNRQEIRPPGLGKPSRRTSSKT